MKKNDTRPFRELFTEEELAFFFDEESEETQTCPGCEGKGRYVGFRWIEDPCRVCGGSGKVHCSKVGQNR